MLILKLGVYSEYLLRLFGENSAKLIYYYQYSLKHQMSSNLDLEVLQKWVKKKLPSFLFFLSFFFFTLHIIADVLVLHAPFHPFDLCPFFGL